MAARSSMSSTPRSTLAFALLLVAALSNAANAQYASPTGEWVRGRARLFIADNTPGAASVIVVDIPAYNISQRMQLPGTAGQLGVSINNEYLGVFRGRDNDQQYFTVISTGVRAVPSFTNSREAAQMSLKAGELGYLRRAAVSKSMLMVNGSDGIGGVEGGRNLVYHSRWSQYITYAESHGLIFTYRADMLHPHRYFTPAATMRLPVGHFHVLPYGNYIIAPHTGAHKAYILARNGTVMREYDCTSCHGSATYEPSATSMTAVFGCNDTVLVVRNTDATGIHVPAFPPRVGSFIAGAPGVFWSASATQDFFWRTDVRGAQPTVTNVTQRGAAIRLAPLTGRSRFLALHRDGNLVLYDGVSGSQLAELQLNASGFPANQTSPSLMVDDAESLVFVAETAAATVHTVEVVIPTTGAPSLALRRSLVVGGTPTIMALAYMPGVTTLDP